MLRVWNFVPALHFPDVPEIAGGSHVILLCRVQIRITETKMQKKTGRRREQRFLTCLVGVIALVLIIAEAESLGDFFMGLYNGLHGTDFGI